jgi:hypothetical protein
MVDKKPLNSAHRSGEDLSKAPSLVPYGGGVYNISL